MVSRREINKQLLALITGGIDVAEGKVQICEATLAKNFPLGFLQGSAVQDNDPLALAFLSGIAVALDVDR